MIEGDMPIMPLDYLRQFIGANPWHFWNQSNTSIPLPPTGCNGLYRELGWQDADAMSRSDMRRAIASAERMINEALGFWPAPRYGDITIVYPRPFDRSMSYAASIGSDGRWMPVNIETGYIQALGVETLTLISDTVAVAFSDSDGDGVNDTFTATVATTVTDPTQIAVYFSTADRYDSSPVGERWRIEPVRVSISAGTATIRGPSWLLVTPALLVDRRNNNTARPNGYDPASPATYFVDTIAVYRRWTDGDGTTNETSQGLLTWETPPWPVWACCCGCGTTTSTGSNDPASIATAIARVGIRDARHGLVIPGQAAYNSSTGLWDATSWDGCRQPDRVTIRYLAGYPTVGASSAIDYRQMDQFWRDIVCMLACAELGRLPNSCNDYATRQIAYWQTDMAFAGEGAERYNLTMEDLSNPFGTRRGHISAWKRCSDYMQRPGFIVG